MVVAVWSLQAAGARLSQAAAAGGENLVHPADGAAPTSLRPGGAVVGVGLSNLLGGGKPRQLNKLSPEEFCAER